MLSVKYNRVTSHAGDSNVIDVPLDKGNFGVIDWSVWTLLFTAKENVADSDVDAKVQKVTGAGLEIVSGRARLDIVVDDTKEFLGTLYCDVRGTHNVTGGRQTFAEFLWEVLPPIGQGVDSSIPIFTTNPPAISGGFEVLTGTDDPNDEPVEASGLGQFYRQGEESPYTWWIWDGTAWTLQGSGEAPVDDSPTFTAFGITDYSNGQVVEVGTTFTGSKTFTWTTSFPENVEADSISIDYLTGGSSTVASGLANDGTETVTSASPWNAAFTTAGKVFRITGTNNEAGNFTADFNLPAVHPWFYGKVTTSTRPTADQALIDSGTAVVAASTGSITAPFSSGSGDYIWFAIPASSGVKTAWYVTALNNGSIGGSVSPSGNLFPDADVVSITKTLWSGVSYNIYVANYRTAVGSVSLF